MADEAGRRARAASCTSACRSRRASRLRPRARAWVRARARPQQSGLLGFAPALSCAAGLAAGLQLMCWSLAVRLTERGG